MHLNDRIRHALHLMEATDRSLFITCRAGTGKSTLLSHFCARTKKRPVVLAPTGVAALNVKGQTIHKFFNFYIDVTPEKIRRRQIKPRSTRLYQKLRTLIIDEISMVRADLLDCVDEFLRLYGPVEGAPFGGVQMIFVGDLYQLPPVVRREDAEHFESRYETPYFFSAGCLKEVEFSVIELDTIYRQRDTHFIELLNRVRDGDARAEDIEKLNARYQPGYTPPTDQFFIHLTTTNRRADEINAQHLAALEGRQRVTNAKISGDFGKEYYPTATELQFKIGAQIMLITNDTGGRFVNGSIGVVEGIERDDDDRAYVAVKLEGEEATIEVYPHTWEVYKYRVDGGELVAESIGSFTQFPFRLAWAVTIHKSQGKSFDHVMLDMDRGAFASGQLYVALSRCRSFEGLVLMRPLSLDHVLTDTRILAFLEAHRYQLPAELPPLDPRFEVPVSPAELNRPPLPATARVREILSKLAEGVDPIAGAPFAEDSPYRHPEILAALRYALTMRDPRKPRKGKGEAEAAPEATTAQGEASAPARVLPINAGKAWAEEDRARVGSLFQDGKAIADIAEALGRTNGSILAELMKQGLISTDNFRRTDTA